MPINIVHPAADLSTLEARLTAARAGYLDYLDYSNGEVLYLLHSVLVDDLPGLQVGGTVGNPERFLNNDVTTSLDILANQYIEIDFIEPTYIKKFRYYGSNNSEPGNRYSLTAYVDSSWEDCLLDIVDIDADEWGIWHTLTTPRLATLWRFTNTTYVQYARLAEAEFLGVRMGA